jgi:protease II
MLTYADVCSIPLVSTEWNEWGNPNVGEELAVIRSYDPMLNIKVPSVTRSSLRFRKPIGFRYMFSP